MLSPDVYQPILSFADPVAQDEKEKALTDLLKFHKKKCGSGCATCNAAVDLLGWPTNQSFMVPSRFTAAKDVMYLMRHYNLVPTEDVVVKALAALGEVDARAAPAPPPPSATLTAGRTATEDDGAGGSGHEGTAGASVAARDVNQGSGEANQGEGRDADVTVDWAFMQGLPRAPPSARAHSETAAAAAAERDASRMVVRGEAERAAALDAFTPSMAALAMEEPPAPATDAGGAAGRNGGGAAAGAAAGRVQKRGPGRPSLVELEARRQAERQQEVTNMEEEEARQSKRGRTIQVNPRYKN